MSMGGCVDKPLVSLPEKISEVCSRQRKQLAAEQDRLGDYFSIYESLADFRHSWGVYQYEDISNADGAPKWKITITQDCHVLDHHVLAYVAPMSFKRIGFGHVMRTPVEQIKMMSDDLRAHGIRLIYAALPNKAAVYP